MPPKKDITGQVFGNLKAIRCTGEKYHGSYIWEYECLLCGKRITAVIGKVSNGAITSCGCGKLKNLRTKSNKEKMGQYYDTNVSRIKSNKIPKNNTSGCTGVSLQRKKGKSDRWVAYIYFRKKCYYLGSFENIEDAIKIRKTAEKEIYGEFLKWYEQHKQKGEDKNADYEQEE